jgi:hypothetical protein
VSPGAAGQVPDNAVLDRHREHFAPRSDQHPLTVGADIEPFEILRDFDEFADEFAQLETGIRRHGDRKLTIFIAADIENTERTVQFVDNAMGAIVTCPAHVTALVAGQLACLPVAGVVSVNIQVA